MDADCEPEPSSGSDGLLRTGWNQGDVDAGYPVAFWIAYVANVAVVTANALTYRFAELIGHLGGSESTAGIIISIATAVSLLSRVFLGQAIDRYGVRRLWITSSLLFVAGGALLTVAESLSPVLHVARSLFAIGLAGIFTCANVYVQGMVPSYHRTEAIGTLGSGGFVGMFLGTAVGDAIFHGFSGDTRFAVLFGVATLLGALNVALIVFVTREDRHVRPPQTPPLHRLLVHHWPGNVILVALVMGLMVAVTTVFLTRFATQRGLTGLGPFFASYAVSAFAFRLISRGWSRTVGRHRMILLGLAGHAAAMFLLPFVTSEWLFAVPAVFGGFGHALLFPAVVSLGAEAFPREYRGTGTTIVMGFFDVGTFVSAPLLGGILDAFDGNGFTTMFLTAGIVATFVAVLYGRTAARLPDSDLISVPPIAAETVHPASVTVRHSPIEPSVRAARKAADREPEDSVVIATRSAMSPNRAAAVVPATRCR